MKNITGCFLFNRKGETDFFDGIIKGERIYKNNKY